MKYGVNNLKLAPNKKVVVFRATDSILSELRKSMHAEKHQFGGYGVHGSLEEAKAYIKNFNAAIQNQPNRRYTIDNQNVADQLQKEIIPDNLERTAWELGLEFCNRYYTSTHGIEASNWIQNLWEGIASTRNDITVAPFIHNSTYRYLNFPQHSRIITIKGHAQGNEIVMIGAHLDSINTNDQKDREIENRSARGVDDNASGIAILTELLRVVVKTGYQPERTVQLIGFAAEEMGLRGSKDISRTYNSSGENVAGMLNLDMSGYRGGPEDVYIITDYTNKAQNEFLSDLKKVYLPNVTYGNTKCGYACSDHASWFAQGYPASFLFESDFSKYNNKIHSSQDTKVDKDHIKKFARLAAVYIAELAKGKTGMFNATLPQGN